MKKLINKRTTQGGVVSAEQITICDVCGDEIGYRDVGYAVIFEAKTPTQIRLMEEAGAHDEFEHICLSCWTMIKEELRKLKEQPKESRDISNS